MPDKKNRTRSYRISTSVFEFQNVVISRLNNHFKIKYSFSTWANILWQVFFSDEKKIGIIFSWVREYLEEKKS